MDIILQAHDVIKNIDEMFKINAYWCYISISF